MRSIQQTFFVLVLLAVSGCSQVSEQLSDWLKPPSSAEMNVRIQDQAALGEVQEALRKGEAFLAKNPADAAQLHMTMSELYLRVGDALRAMQHMQMATASLNGAVGNSAPAVAPPVAPNDPAQVGVQATTEGASARVLPDGGVEVRAGPASAKVVN